MLGISSSGQMGGLSAIGACATTSKLVGVEAQDRKTAAAGVLHLAIWAGPAANLCAVVMLCSKEY